jgi:hypothetical protein
MCAAMPADAALLDWLFPRRRAAQRQYYVLPAGTAPAGITPTTGRYTTNYGSWGPSTTPYAWYAPQTQYRSLWTQVPTTTYRPVGANGLQPCTSYAWQTQRVPVTAFQPVVGAAAAPVAVAPAASSCGCAGAATTAYYGSTPAYSQAQATAWQTVAPSTGNLYAYGSTATWAPATSSAMTGAAVTAGYAPDMGNAAATVDYAGATPWMPVDDTYTQTDEASEWQPYAGSAGSSLPSSGDNQGSDAQGSATPWQPVDSAAEPTPADRSPTLNRPDYDDDSYRNPTTDSERESDGTRTESQRPDIDDRWRQYEDNGPDPDAGGSTTRTGHFRPRMPNSNQRFVPFQRPIPDPDDDYNWDFDDKFRLRDRPQRSARRSDARWEAIPVNATFTPEPPGSVRSQHDRSKAPADDLLPPARPRRPGNEGGWRSLAH